MTMCVDGAVTLIVPLGRHICSPTAGRVFIYWPDSAKTILAAAVPTGGSDGQ